MTKGEWYNKLRKRVFSTLYSFSDEEIEEGLEELDRNWFPDTTDLDIVDIKDTMVMLLINRKFINTVLTTKLTIGLVNIHTFTCALHFALCFFLLGRWFNRKFINTVLTTKLTIA